MRLPDCFVEGPRVLVGRIIVPSFVKRDNLTRILVLGLAHTVDIILGQYPLLSSYFGPGVNVILTCSPNGLPSQSRRNFSRNLGQVNRRVNHTCF